MIKADPSEADLHILITHRLMQIQIQRGKRFQDFELLLGFVFLLIQQFLLLLQIQIVMIKLPDKGKHLVF